MEIRINKGQEFKVYTYEDKIIPKDCLFWDEYKKATIMLNNIVSGFQSSQGNGAVERDYQNNIIAFCGDRGAGKTSIMLNFCNAVLNMKNNRDLEFDDIVVDSIFSDNILIDPSMFDNFHNIIDVIVANMFQKIILTDGIDNLVDEKKVKFELLLEKFQKVYKCLSLISDTKKILDNEFDYEGSIGKLSRLGESLELKKQMCILVELYLDFLNGSFDKNKYLIIEVDDIDLCSENAYRMIEQIRKYLMIPNVIIMFAVRIEQLELCVQEKNLGDYPRLSNMDKSGIQREIVQMTEKYLLKLIPEARRIYISGVRLFKYEPKIILDETGKVEYKNTIEAVRTIIYKKTDILLLDEDLQLLIPDGLRGILNLIVYINQLSDLDDDKSAISNIEDIMNYIERVWLQDRKELDSMTKLFISQLIKQDLRWMNESILSFCIDKFHIEDSELTEKGLNQLVKLFNLNKNFDFKLTISAIRLVCIFKCNLEKILQKDKLIYVFRFNIWENNLRAAIGGDRYCISVNTLDTIKLLTNKVSGISLDSNWLYEGATEEKLNCRPTSLKDAEKPFWCEAMLYLLAFVQIDMNKTIIAARTVRIMDSKITVGFAHFLTNIQNLNGIKRYSGILNIFDEQLVDDAILKVESQFRSLSNYLRWLYSNLGLFIYIQDKHTARISYKGKASNKDIVKKLIKDISNLKVEESFATLLSAEDNLNRVTIKEEEIEYASEMYNSISSIMGEDINEIEKWQEDFKKLVFGEKEVLNDVILSVKKRFVTNHKSYTVLKDRYDNVAHNFGIVAYKIKNSTDNEKARKLWDDYITKYSNKLLDICEYYKEVCNHLVDDAMEEVTDSEIKAYLDFAKLWETTNREEWRV